ncbi:MAG TPA: hypothetical protein VMR21_11235 [Vicinamibacteria bacterium]|nr:hypothetical protein [Vicinamibacteria bacterium]
MSPLSSPRRTLAAAALAVLGACASSASLPPSAPLSTALPALLPAEAELQDWERIDGEYQNEVEHVRYSLFVDPALPMLYRVTHYRVSLRVPGGDGSRLGFAWETVIWNEEPGKRLPLRCFTEDRHRSWQNLWIAPRSSWRDVPPATSEFRAHMRRALEIYIRVHNEGRAGPRPRS